MVTLFGYAVLAVFIGAYIIISSEKINRTGMALLGMGIVGFVFWGFYTLWDLGFYTDPAFTNPTNPELWHHGPFEALIGSIEWSTILFVTSMMIIVAVAGSSGMFQYLALRLAKPSNGNPRALYITFLLFVFGISLFFDTVSTMLIMCPLTVEVCRALEIDFKPFLVSEAIVSNFSSIPSIVGAVPNLVIANAIPDSLNAGFLFIVFMPLSALLFIISLPIFLKWFGKSFGESDPHRVDTLLNIHPEYMIKSKRDFYVSVLAIAILIIGFTFGQSISGVHFGLAPAMFALAIGGFMLILSHDRAAEYLANVGWDTVFFLVGLFGLVVALDITGLIDELADAIGIVLGGNAVLAIIFMVWIPAMLSAFLDNLPVSIVLAPIAQQFASLSPVLPLALVFAVNIGGYIFTPLGSPANMVAIGFSEKEHDPISFIEFVKIGTILGMIHLAIGTGWLLLASILVTIDIGVFLLFPLGIIPFVIGLYFLYFKPSKKQ
ncbi:MAG: SLC13 family permease [Candidatus Thorarchaeota archaeon]|nr:SLC13 family permease [Candidatus Thorarchaeota archaeon]